MSLQRFLKIDPAQARRRTDASSDLQIAMAFASELPYERWWGVEVLDMAESSVRLGRLNDSAPVLYNHDWNDLRGVHVPGSVHIGEDRVLRGDVTVTSATQAGRDAIALVESGVLTKASVGYSIHKVIEQTTAKDGRAVERVLDGALFERVLERTAQQTPGDLVAFRRELDRAVGAFERAADEPTVYRVVDWEPFENSLVTIPADPTVGVGRSLHSVPARGVAAAGLNPAAPQSATDPANVATTRGAVSMPEAQAPASASAGQPQQGAPAPNTAQLEEQRRNAIVNLCKANKLDERFARNWISNGTSLETVSEEILTVMEERGKHVEQSPTFLGMERKEVQQWSLFRAINALVSGNWEKAGLELQASRAVQDKTGKGPENSRAILVPMDVLSRSMSPDAVYNMLMQRVLQRDLTAAQASAGGYLVETTNQGFVELLRNASVCFAMGARRLSGLQGNVTIPKRTAGATGYWLGTESTQVTESGQTFGQIAMTPKTAGAYNELSRQLLMQSSPAAEELVMSGLALDIGTVVDLAGLTGSGNAGQPLGVINTSGIGAVTGTSFDYADIIEFQTDVATANALAGSLGYVTTPAIAGLAKARVKFANTASPLWEGRLERGLLDGYPAMSSNQMPSGDMLFGDWSQLVIGEWGVLEIAVNQQANFQAAIIGVRALYSVDMAVRIPAAFSLMTSAT